MLLGDAGVTGALFARYLLTTNKERMQEKKLNITSAKCGSGFHDTARYGREEKICQQWNVTPSTINTTQVDWGWLAAAM
jgi:hypothetical protein